MVQCCRFGEVLGLGESDEDFKIVKRHSGLFYKGEFKFTHS